MCLVPKASMTSLLQKYERARQRLEDFYTGVVEAEAKARSELEVEGEAHRKVKAEEGGREHTNPEVEGDH